MRPALAQQLLFRLVDFVDGFAGCFGRQAQRAACSLYVRGLLSASERKSIQAMADGKSDAEYQRMHHFIADSPWDCDEIWTRLWERIPDRSGVVVIDDTGFHKQGEHSVGAARQYCPPLGKVANCQIAVTSVLRSKNSTWPLGMELYLPESWIDDEDRRERAEIPASAVAKTKWELAIRQLRRAKSAGFAIRGVAADAGYGNIDGFRDAIARLGLRYVVRISGKQTLFTERPTRDGERWVPAPETAQEFAARLPESAFRSVAWGKGSKGILRIRVSAHRVFLGRRWHRGEPIREAWLLVRRKRDGSHKLYLSNLPRTAKLLELVQIAYSRWAIEQSYQQLKDDLGFDHFECRSWPAWNHHAVLCAMAFIFLGIQRRRHRIEKLPTIPAIRKVLSRLTTALTLVEDPFTKKLVASLGRDPPRF